MAKADHPKSGFVTSEFVAWLVTNWMALVALAGVFDVHGDARTNASIRVAALLASAFSTGLYAHARSAVKSAVALARFTGTPPVTPSEV